jgi:excisionase family DNA binding protein
MNMASSPTFDREPVTIVHESPTLSIAEAARRLGISRGLAYELVARGELRSLRPTNEAASLSLPSRAE